MNTIMKMKRQSLQWEKMFANYISDKRLIENISRTLTTQ